jgi:SAM-dependent methyltransferase
VTSGVSFVIRWWQGRRSLGTAPLRTLHDLPPGRAVDIGCGRGDLGGLLVRQGWQVTGVEPSASACQAARRRGVDARQGTLADVDLESGAYDAAIFRHSLEHSADPPGDLATVVRALRPGGLVLITVPNFGCWQRRRFGSCWYHLDLPRHRIHLTAPGLRAALNRAGAQVASVATSTSSVGLPASVQYRLAGRCLFPGGLGLRIASGLCVLVLPVAWVLDRALGGGDQLHVVGQRPT